MNKLVPMLVGALALLSGSAIAADMSVMPVKAPPEPALAPSGYVDLSMGGGRFKETFCAIGFACDPTSSNTGWSIGGAGRGNWWLGRSVSLQLDAQAEGTQYTLNTFGCTTCGNRTSTTAYDIIAHLAWRDPRWAFGAMAAVGDVSPGVRTAAVGPEGLVNLGMFTLYAQGGWTATVGRNAFVGNDISGGFVRGTARFYPTQNILLEGTVQGAWLTEDPFDPTFLATHDIQSTIWRVKAEGMVNPWLSVYAAYQGSRTRLESGPVPPLGFGFDETLRDDRFVVGIRAWLGRDNLRNNDITGAPFDFINPINFFGPFAGMS